MESLQLGRCCVFQPREESYDLRFEEVLAPAIQRAGMIAGVMEQNLNTKAPSIITLHQAIQSAEVCLADITTRNSVVMYAVGFAMASHTKIVVISGPSAEVFPFNIQSLDVIRYSRGSLADFSKLGDDITNRLRAILRREKRIASIITETASKEGDMLAAHEVMALALLLKYTATVGHDLPEYRLREEMHHFGYTELATRLSVVNLSNSGLIKVILANGKKGRKQVTYTVTKLGEEWLIDHQEMLQMRVQDSDLPGHDYFENYSPGESFEITDEDIPFQSVDQALHGTNHSTENDKTESAIKHPVASKMEHQLYVVGQGMCNRGSRTHRMMSLRLSCERRNGQIGQ